MSHDAGGIQRHPRAAESPGQNEFQINQEAWYYEKESSRSCGSSCNDGISGCMRQLQVQHDDYDNNRNDRSNDDGCYHSGFYHQV